MTTGMFDYFGIPDGFFNRFLNSCFMDIMLALFTSTKISKPFDPSNIRLFGSSTIVKSLNFLTNEIKKPMLSLFWLINIVNFIPVILVEILF